MFKGLIWLKPVLVLVQGCKLDDRINVRFFDKNVNLITSPSLVWRWSGSKFPFAPTATLKFAGLIGGLANGVLHGAMAVRIIVVDEFILGNTQC